jgi:predicted amidohydrolase YtcJ
MTLRMALWQLTFCMIAATAASAQAPATARILLAKKILTMNPDQPTATAVAVRDGRILSVGDLASVRAAAPGATEDATFADRFLIAGLIEPHLHPYIAGILLPMEFVTAHDWKLPGREVEGVRGRDAYLARLRELHAADGDPGHWLWTWGYHNLFHGTLTRTDLDAISTTRPIVVWHRSFHEIFVNSPALTAMGVTAETVGDNPQVELAEGHFFEGGLRVALNALAPRLLEPQRYGAALALGRQVVHAGGITTVGDGAFGTLDLEQEWQSLASVWDGEETPFRSILLPDGRSLGEKLGSHEKARALIETLPARNTHRLRFPEKAVKLFADGAFYSQLMQMGEPYTDGHHGEWLMEPAELEAAARVYWNAGYQINVHANGDLGVKTALDVLEKLQNEHPRTDHRYALHHLGYSTQAQARRMAALGAIVSANPYYLWALGDLYAKVGLGPERASHMVQLGSLQRSGVRFSFHSDFTMAPAEPLTLAWVATNRITSEGTLMAPDERITLDAALRAVTIDAAHLLRMESEIGSVEPGKLADFTVLAADPTEVPLLDLKDVPIWGTVFEGRSYPLRPATSSTH